jgi:arabinogalactan oligomer / maltooligosaccharide transport system substrate-binding protein
VNRAVSLGLAAALAAGAMLGIIQLSQWAGVGEANLADAARQSGSVSDLRGLIYMAVGIPPEETVDTELRVRNQALLEQFSKAFRDLNPGVSIQLLTFPESEMLEQIRRRQQAGLGPDLLVVQASTALELHRAGLARAIAAPRSLTDQIEPTLLARVRLHDGRVAGLPLLVQPELACFNRQRLPQGSPADLDSLLRLSAGGVRVGMSIDPLRLLWTVGSLGASPALERASRGEPLSAEDRRQLKLWLAWLQNAAFQQRINFLGSQEDLLTELKAGQLDWITCRSSSLVRLRSHLDQDLGVAPLPGGPGGAATPINLERVLALGVNSSRNQREIALELIRFSLNPLSQRKLTMENLDVLPANRFVPVPVASSATLASMVRSAEAGEQASPLLLNLMANRAALPALSNLLPKVIFGDLDPREAAEQMVTRLKAGRR